MVGNESFVKLPKRDFASLIAVAIGLMLSSEPLTLLGNNAGVAGNFLLASIPAVMLLHLFTALSFGEKPPPFPGPEGEPRFIKQALGSIPAIVLSIGSRVLFTICATTGILATAGYVFNEMFLYWFPNLLFSFCLLGVILIINLIGRKFSETAQLVFVTMALLGILFLSASGLSGSGNDPLNTETVNPSAFHMARGVLAVPILFLGYDLAGLAIEKNRTHPFDLVKAMVGGLLLVGLIFYLWGVVSLYTRAGIWLWFLNYAMIHLCVLIMRSRAPKRPKHLPLSDYQVFPAVAFTVWMMILFGLLWTDVETALLIKAVFLLSPASLFTA